MLCTSIAAQVRQNARTCAARAAIGGPCLCYAQVWERIESVAAALRHADVTEQGGIRPISYLLPNGIDAVLVPLACQVARLTAVPLDYRLTATELTDRIIRTRATLVISGGSQLGQAADLGAETIDVASIDPAPGVSTFTGATEGDRPLLVGYTSGTTGRPKGALYSGDRLYLDYVRWGWHYGITASDTFLTAAPLFHNSYLGLSLLALMTGAPNRIMTSFDPCIAREELTKRATFSFLVPAMLDVALVGWREDGHSLSAARIVLSSGVPVHVDLLSDALAAFSHAKIAEAYGWSGRGWVTFEAKRLGAMVPGCVGWPMIEADLVLVGDHDQLVGAGETGEVAVRGLTPFGGYVDEDEATAASEWHGYHRSGDIGRWLADGRLCLCDRKEDTVISGGENVYSAEVERVLATRPSVAETAVVGQPSKRWGEEVVAFVVPAGPAIESEIDSQRRQHLAGFKVPKRIEFVDPLPRNAMGKTLTFLPRYEIGTEQ